MVIINILKELVLYEVFFRFEKRDKFYHSLFWKYAASFLRCGASQRGLDGGAVLGRLPGRTSIPQDQSTHSLSRLQDSDKSGLSWLQRG